MTQPAGPASLRRAGPAFFVLLPTPPTGRPSPALPRRHVAAVRNPGPSQESQSSGNWSHPGSCLLEHASQPAPRRCRPARLTRPRLNHASQRLGSVLSRPPRIPGADNPGVNQSRPPAHTSRPTRFVTRSSERFPGDVRSQREDRRPLDQADPSPQTSVRSRVHDSGRLRGPATT
jgi:hypothetical protein